VGPSCVPASAADVGGVGGPVPGGDLLPLDRGLDVDAECLGQDGGRDVGGQGEQGGGTALPQADPEGVEPLGERVLGQRASRLASRDQPGRTDAELLGVEQDEEPGDPAGGRVCLLAEEPARVCPPAVLVERAGRAGPARGRGGKTGRVPAGDCPADEVRRPDTVTGGPGQPPVEQNCLIYDRPLAAHGLTWRDLVAWWADREKLTGQPERAIWGSLYRRLLGSIDAGNGAERRIFTAYGKRYGTLGAGTPALLPQVYLHYDPYTRASYQPGTAPPLPRQRMDFLLLLPNRYTRDAAAPGHVPC
jgi:hypothetical protein